MNVWIYNSGSKLSEAEQQAGRRAAMDVFERHGADPEECLAARNEIDNFDELAGGTISSVVQSRASIWAGAENAAIAAATEGWARIPDDLSLGLA